MNDDLSINLKKHETKNTVDQHVNGSLTVIWRDWDNIIKHEPKMVYVSSVNPEEIRVHILTQKEIVILFVFMEKYFLLYKIKMALILKLNRVMKNLF